MSTKSDGDTTTRTPGNQPYYQVMFRRKDAQDTLLCWTRTNCAFSSGLTAAQWIRSEGNEEMLYQVVKVEGTYGVYVEQVRTLEVL